MLNAARGGPTQGKTPLIAALSAWTCVNALVLEIQARRARVPPQVPPCEGERSSGRESLKTLPPNCCATIHAKAGWRARYGASIVSGLYGASRWAAFAHKRRRSD